MELLCVVSLLIWACGFAREMPRPDVTHEELEAMDASCSPLDSCKFPRYADTLLKYTCNCDSSCSLLDTCCIDSRYRGKAATGFKPSCKRAHGTYNVRYYMVDECPSDENVDSTWKNLCSDYEFTDLMTIVPVTSLTTNVTYKNYFCYRCHEPEDKPVYWSINVLANSVSTGEVPKDVKVTYDKDHYSWMATVGEDGQSMPVTISIEVPSDISNVPKLCRFNVISNCLDSWQDDDTRHKCGAYTSFVYFTKNDHTFTYKNPHCAKCNYEDLEQMMCSMQTHGRTSSKRPFSFTYLLDINRSGGGKVGETQRCDEGSVWDPFFSKCRVLKCALPGYVMKEGKCTPP